MTDRMHGEPMKQPRKILISSDNSFEASLLDHLLGMHGWIVCTANAADLVTAARDERPDLIVHLTETLASSASDVARELRAHGTTRACLYMIVHADSTELARLHVLEAGADELVSKATTTAELLQRIGVLLRRVGNGDDNNEVRAGDILLNIESRAVRRGPRSMQLAPLEAKLLQYLMNNRDRLISRQELMDRVWGQTAVLDARTVDVAVNRLRRSLNVSGELDPIRTVHGKGYTFGVAKFVRPMPALVSRGVEKLATVFTSLQLPFIA